MDYGEQKIVWVICNIYMFIEFMKLLLGTQGSDCLQYLPLPSGHPSKYWEGSMVFTFNNQVGIGTLSMISKSNIPCLWYKLILWNIINSFLSNSSFKLQKLFASVQVSWKLYEQNYLERVLIHVQFEWRIWERKN